MSMNDDRFDQLLWEMAHDEETPLPPGLDGRLEEIYARLEREDGSRTKKEEKPVKRKIITLARAAAFAAVVALMAVSVTVGALAFSTEKVVEVPVPVEQETIVMEDIGITLILPDSWKDKYVAVEGGNCYAVYVKSVYDYCMARGFFDEQGPYVGRLFAVTRWFDEPMTPEEFYDRIPVPAIYLMSTEEGTYCLGRPSDLQAPVAGALDGLDMDDPEIVELVTMEKEYLTMDSEVADIQLVLNGAMKGALNQTGYEE